MNRSKWIILGVVAVVLIGAVIALSSGGRGGSSGGLVNGAELQTLIDEGTRVVDVRTPAEYESGHIPGALNVPVNEVAAAAAEWDTSEPIALYCATGSRSADAAATLRSLGFKTVYDLSGGMMVWEGDVEGGPAAAAATAGPSATGLPVMYEFYTDW